MPFTTTEGADIYWKLDGRSGAPGLVLLNSISTDMDLWDRLLPGLRQRFAVLRIDTRGHGASSAPEGDYVLPQLANDVAVVMQGAGLSSAAVAGVSLGGMIAMELALARPALVGALALVCTSATMDSASWGERIAKVRAGGMASIVDLAMGRFLSPQFVAEQPEVAETVRRQLVLMDPAGYAGCGAAIRDMTLAGRIGAIACPTLVVSGERDTSTPFAGHGDYLMGHLKGARHVSLDAAHLAPLEAPDALAAALTEFLQG